MNEHENHHFHAQDEHVEQAPSTLMPVLLARLGLDRSEQVPEVSLAVLKAALSNPDWIVRIDAVQKLEHVRDEESFRLLLSALHDEDDSVRACAIRVLGVRSDLAKHIALEQLEAALHDSEWHVRETAVYALAVLGDQTTLIVLKDALYDTDDAVRYAALKATQQIQHSTNSTGSVEERSDDRQALSSFQSLIGMWSQHMRRFALHLYLRPRLSTDTEKDLDMLEEIPDVKTEYPPVTTERKSGTKRSIPPRQAGPQRRLMRVLEQGLAAVLILALLAGWFALSQRPHSSSGSPSAFSDAGARSLGKPVAMIQGDFIGSEDWSPDGHTLVYLQVNTQKHELEANMLDAATGRSTLYPVLDSSWVPTSLEHYNPLMVVGGRYLLALRAHGTNQATLEIWDIVGHRAITTQTVLARISSDGQVVSPQIVPSNNEQKFATYSPDGTVAIWDVASGQKLVTCEGKIPPGQVPFAYIKWYNHDQDLLFNSDLFNSHDGNDQIAAWNVATGTRLFNVNANGPHKKYMRPEVSPNNKYLAVTTVANTPDASHYVPDALEILDAYSGQVLHRYPLAVSGVSFVWLPDSQHLLIITSSGASPLPSNQTVRISTWDISTNQVMPVTSSSADGFNWPTADGQYMMLGSRDGRSIKIWQTSNGHLVAAIETPGIPARTDAFSLLGNQYLVIGQRENFYIWSIATGKLLYSYHGSTPFSLYGQSGSIVTWSPSEKYLFMIAGSSPSIGKGSLAVWRMP